MAEARLSRARPKSMESVFSGNEDQPLCLRFLCRLNLPIGVTLDLLETSCLKIVKDVPVGEESQTFMLSKDVHAVWSLDYLCFLPPSYTVKWVEVSDLVNAYESHSWDTGFVEVMSLLDCLERKPVFAFIEGVCDVADHYSA
jgi:hypothetical protein